MRPVTTATYTHVGNSKREIEMKIDLANAPQLMEMMTSLYSDPKLAVIREYSTNALDSQVEANNSDPINITLPTTFNPTFTVKDCGIGMSVNDLDEIYSSYGTSTKRLTDEQTGMLGVGGKSGLTIADQFTITAIKDGIKAVAVMTRRENGSGVIKILDTCATDEPNGFEVSIPINPSDVSVFNSKAESFFSWWEDGTVLVNGSKPALMAGWEKVSANSYASLGGEYYTNTHYIIMGNIAYPMTNEAYDHYSVLHSERMPYGVSGAIRVPIGSVEFTPSRESLKLTAATKSYCKTAYSRMFNDTKAHVAKTWATFTDMEKWRNASDFDQWSFRDAPTLNVDDVWSVGRDGGTSGNFYAGSLINGDIVVIKDYSNVNLTKSNGVRIRGYMEKNDIEASHVLVPKDYKKFAKDNDWFKVEEIDWADAKKFKVTRQTQQKSTNVRKLTDRVNKWGSMYDWHTDYVAMSDVSDEHYIISPTVGSDAYSTRRNITAIHNFLDGKGVDVLLVNANSHEKHLRENKEAGMLSEYLTKASQAWYNGLTKAQRVALDAGRHRWAVDGTGDDDMQAVFDASILSDVNVLRNERSALIGAFRAVNEDVPSYLTESCDELSNVYSKYPMLEAWVGDNTQVVAEYVKMMKENNE